MVFVQQRDVRINLGMKALRRLASSLIRPYSSVLTKGQTTAAAAVTSADDVIKDAKPFEQIPRPKGLYSIPLLGVMLHFKPFTNLEIWQIQQLYKYFLDTYGSVCKVKMGEWTVYVEDPADIQTVFRNEGRVPHRPMPEIHVAYSNKRGLIAGIASMKGEEWYNLRKAVNAKFMVPSAPLHYLEEQNKVADDFVAKLLKHDFTPAQLQNEFFKYATESISVVTFNKRLGMLDENLENNSEKAEIFKRIREVFVLFGQAFHYSPYFLGVFETPLMKKYTKCVDFLRRHVNEYLMESLDELERLREEGRLDKQEKNFLLSLLSNKTFDIPEIEMLVFDLFVAGTDSTAQNLQMFLYNLARHPDKQEKLFHEIRTLMGSDGALQAEHIAQMHYLKACLKESFRIIYPTATGTGRYIAKDVVLGGYHVPKGTLCVICNPITVKREKYFSQPEEFLPERWLRDEKGNRQEMFPAMALLPFGFGPRNCLGRRFAEQEIYLAVTKLLQKFRIELEPKDQEVEVAYSVFVKPKNPIGFKFVPR